MSFGVIIRVESEAFQVGDLARVFNVQHPVLLILMCLTFLFRFSREFLTDLRLLLLS